jgi:hypothetical protein
MSDADEEMMAFMAEINKIPAASEETTEDKEETTIVEAPAKVQKVAAVCVAASAPVYAAPPADPAPSSSSSKFALDAKHGEYSTTIDSSYKFVAPLPPGPKPMQTSFKQVDPTTGEAKVHVRKAAGKAWVDPTLSEWPENDFRLFVGDLAKEVGSWLCFRLMHGAGFLLCVALCAVYCTCR